MQLMLACRNPVVCGTIVKQCHCFTLSSSLARIAKISIARISNVDPESRSQGSRVFVATPQDYDGDGKRRGRNSLGGSVSQLHIVHNVVRILCGVVRGRSCRAKILGHLPDDGSFSAVTHVAMQNTGIARAWSILLRRRRGYVNWGVNAGRRDAYRSTLPPSTRAPACCLVPCVPRLSCPRGYPRDARGPDICVYYQVIQRWTRKVKTQKHAFREYNLGEKKIYNVIAWGACIIQINYLYKLLSLSYFLKKI